MVVRGELQRCDKSLTLVFQKCFNAQVYLNNENNMGERNYVSNFNSLLDENIEKMKAMVLISADDVLYIKERKLNNVIK